MALLKVENLRVSVEGKEILRGVDLEVGEGEVVALMGPNGSGKSTLAQVLMGHPGYEIVGGRVSYLGNDLLKLKPEERARAGMFLSFQYPQEIAGVSIGQFLRMAYNATREKKLSAKEFVNLLLEKMTLLGVPKEFMRRSVNEGFSGGEKKRTEMLQLAVLEPRLAILDETDSGLDMDALKAVAGALKSVREKNPRMAILLITHYQRILDHLPAERVAVTRDGRIVRQGNQAEILADIEREGYGKLG